MDCLMHYVNPAHPFSLLSVLNSQRLNGQLCDVTLIIGDQKFQAHRNVLVASCEYFQALFSRREADSQAVVHLDFCEPDVFENVLNYIYSSSLFVSKQNISAVQELGYSLGIPFLAHINTENPHVTFSVSRNTLFSEYNGSFPRTVTDPRTYDNGFQGSFDITFSSPQEMPASASAQSTEKSVLFIDEPCQLSEHEQHNEALRNTASTPCSVEDIKRNSADKPSVPVSSLKERANHAGSSLLSGTSSSTCSETQTQQEGAPLDNMHINKDPQLENCKDVDPDNSNAFTQTDTVGALQCSVLPNSSVSSTLLHFDKKESVVKMVPENSTDPEKANKEIHESKPFPILLLPCKSGKTYETDVHSMDAPVKPEPSSPLADTADIIRVVIGDNFPADFGNLSVDLDDEPNGVSINKREATSDAEWSLSEKSKSIKDDTGSEVHGPGFTVLKLNRDTLRGVKQTRIFKCSSYCKVLRSGEGMHHHVDASHGLEKAYAYDDTGLDETSHPTSTGLTQQRGLRRSSRLWASKSRSIQSQKNKNFRTRLRNNICPQCGKTFRFLSQLKQHLKKHSGEKFDCVVGKNRELSPAHNLNLQSDKNFEVGSSRCCREKPSPARNQREERYRYPITCPYCVVRFPNAAARDQHETVCEYKKLTCLKCVRTFKSSFSIWRHQMEVHNQNLAGPKDLQDCDNNTVNDTAVKSSTGDAESEDCSELVLVVSEDGSLNKRQQKLKRNREPSQDNEDSDSSGGRENLRQSNSSLWTCEKCGNSFGTPKQMEHHQEVQCYVKPFACHVCKKSFRTNFRLWSHIQSHRSRSSEACSRKSEPCAPSNHSQSPSPGKANMQAISKRSKAPRRQVAEVAAVPSKQQHVCNHCQRTFRTAFSLWSHERTHN